MLERGSLLPTTKELENMGFGIAIYCTGPLYAAAGAVKRYLETAAHGDTKSIWNDLNTFSEFNNFVALMNIIRRVKNTQYKAVVFFTSSLLIARYANILAISLSKYACPLFLQNKKSPDPSNGSGGFQNSLDCLEKILIQQDFHYKPACTSIAPLRYSLAICLCCP